MKKILSIISIGTFSLMALSSRGDTVAKWTFEAVDFPVTASQTPAPSVGSMAADQGSGTASAFHTSALTVWSTPVGNGSANSFSANNWGIGDYFQFQASGTGFQSFSVSYDQTGSATGPRDFNFQYSTDGSAFTTFGSTYAVLLNGAPNGSWTSGTALPAYTSTYDLSGITALNGAPNVYFRITDASGTAINNGSVGTGGTDRIDNFTISAVAVPEPSTYALMGIGSLLVLFRRRFQSKK